MGKLTEKTRKKMSIAAKNRKRAASFRLDIALKNEPNGRLCHKCCEKKSISDFKYINGKKCSDCCRVEANLRHLKAYRANIESYREHHRKYSKAYRIRNRKKVKEWDKQHYLRRKSNPAYIKYRKEYVQSDRGRAAAERGFNKFVENHPLYNQEYLAGIARKAWIHCPQLNFDAYCRISLDAGRQNKNGSDYNLYSAIDSKQQIA